MVGSVIVAIDKMVETDLISPSTKWNAENLSFGVVSISHRIMHEKAINPRAHCGRNHLESKETRLGHLGHSQ